MASKAVLRWDLAGSPSVPEDVKARLRTRQRRRITSDGELLLTSQRFRDQARNVEDCLDKLRVLLAEAAIPPPVRRPTRPSRASHRRRVQEKRRRTATKQARRPPADD